MSRLRIQHEVFGVNGFNHEGLEGHEEEMIQTVAAVRLKFQIHPLSGLLRALRELRGEKRDGDRG